MPCRGEVPTTEAHDAVSRFRQEYRHRRSSASSSHCAHCRRHGKIFRRRLFRACDGRQGGLRFSHRMRDASRFGHHAAHRGARGRCLCQRRSGGDPAREALAPLQAPAQGPSRRSRRRQRKRGRRAPRRCGELRHRGARTRQRRGRGCGCVRPGHHRRIDHHAETVLERRSWSFATPSMGASISSTAAPTAISAGSTRRRSAVPGAIDGVAGPPYGPPASRRAVHHTSRFPHADQPNSCRLPISSRRTR